jgi:hypothetical protein
VTQVTGTVVTSGSVATATCPTGVAVGGGWSMANFNTSVSESKATSAATWSITLSGAFSAGNGRTLTAYVLCAA